MDKSQGPKAALKQAQTGTPVAEKDFSSKQKENKASGADKASANKGSMTVALDLPKPEGSYEGSYRDAADDYRAARRKGVPVEQYEGSAHDRIADKAGAKRSREEEAAKVDHAPGYKAGVAAFSNSPKVSHGYGHGTSNRDGHLRNSGHSGAHRIGKKK